MSSVPVLNYDSMVTAAKGRLKAVREATLVEIVARLRANYSCRHSWLKISSEAAFERVYLFHFFREFGTDGDIFVEMKASLEASGRALNHHLRSVASTWPSMDADDLAMGARKMMKIQFGELFCDLVELAFKEDIKSEDIEPLRNADLCPFRAGKSPAASQCSASSESEVWADVLPVSGSECEQRL